MAALVGASQVNGSIAPSTTEQEDFYTQLLRLRDAVIAGQHPQLKLPASAIEQLKASLREADLSPGDSQGVSHTANSQFPTSPSSLSLPGLGQSSAQPSVPQNVKKVSLGGLDPIFLEKSDSLIRAEGALKRQRIERELDQQVHERRNVYRDRDQATEAPSQLDIDAVLHEAQQRVIPLSGLSSSKDDDASSFDTNSYYSSKVGDTWSESSASYDPEDVTGAFTADFEQLDEIACDAPNVKRSRRAGKVSEPSHYGRVPSYTNNQRVYPTDDDDLRESEDEDEEYSPPDATLFDSLRQDGGDQSTPQDADDDDDYEPGEIGNDSTFASPTYPVRQPAQASPRVPIIRNHLTHIAAPQPNRVSPLAVAKGPNMELGLVNGKPELVQKPRYGQPSRPSSGSPVNGHNSSTTKRRRNKKRKREVETSNRGSKKRNRLSGARSPLHSEALPYIKPEPISPPPFATAPEALTRSHDRRAPRMPAEIDLISPRQAPPAQQTYEHAPAPRSALRYEYMQPSSATVRKPASPLTQQRPVQRDTHDLRKIATLQHAHRPASPPQVGHPRLYTPVAPYRSTSTAQRTYEPQHQPEFPVHQLQYVSAPTPPQLDDYRPQYGSRGASPALMLPPPPPERKIVVDQYGNRYYAEPTDLALEPRGSIAPPKPRPVDYAGYQEAPAQLGTGYSEAPSTHYDPADARMAPPPPPPHGYADEQIVEYIDSDGRRVRAYTARHAAPQYAPQPPSPVYHQSSQRHEMPPPPPTAYASHPSHEPTSPTYAAPPVIRAYSARSEIPPQTQFYNSAPYQQQAPRYEQPGSSMPPPYPYAPRQASVAPVPYGRQEALAPPQPPRAMSVVAGGDYGGQQNYGYTPQPAVRYIDANGQEVYAQEIRQVSGGQYRY